VTDAAKIAGARREGFRLVLVAGIAVSSRWPSDERVRAP
jgi:hypothetical protein